jgi:hypothetical protein
MFHCDLPEKDSSVFLPDCVLTQPEAGSLHRSAACPEKIEMTVFGCQNIQIKKESGTRKMHAKTARK